MEELLKLSLQQLVGQAPWLATILMVMGALRAIMKPLMELLKVIVKQTPSPKDDAWLSKAMESKFYKTLSFILDWVGSIKLPKK